MPRPPGNDLDLGHLAGRNASLSFPRELRDKHLYVCGGTGVGKTKFLDHLLRQDIRSWRKSKCGVLLLDPHGNLYDSVMEWLAWNKDSIDAPIIPIDLRQDDWVVAYNILRQRKADPQVLIDNVTNAISYVWEQQGTRQTPLFARWAGNVIRALYEKKLTLVESRYLLERVEKQIRYAMTYDLRDQTTRREWAYADTLNAKDFDVQISSTVSRFQPFVHNERMCSIFGQPNVSLDFGKALEEGSIILVNLATRGAHVSSNDASTFATFLLADLWTAAQERGKYDGVKPFYVYLDEFQNFISPTISDNLDQARGFGLHLTMAHQFPNQLLDRGESGRRVYNSIMENASSKVVFRLSHEENLRVLAQWLYMGVMNPDEIKHELHATKVMGFNEEQRETRTRSKGRSEGSGAFRGRTAGASAGGATEGNIEQDSNAWNEYTADSEGDSDTWTESESESVTESTVLVPVIGKELSHVQFRSLEEQLFRGMAVLFDQRERHAVTRLVGMSAPVSLAVPEVHKLPSSKERADAYLASCYEKLPFALTGSEARKQIEERKKQFAEELTNQASDEPRTAKRQIQHGQK